MDKTLGRNEETGGIYPAKDRSYVLTKHYDSYVKAITDTATASLLSTEPSQSFQ